MITFPIKPEVARWVAKQLFLEVYPDHELWFDLAWETALKSPPTPSEPRALDQLPGLGAGATCDAFTQQMALNFAVFAEGLIIQSPLAGDALARRVIRAAEKNRLAKAFLDRLAGRVTHWIEESGHPWAVWDCGADQIVPMTPEHLPPAELEERFWKRRHNYDIFIRDRSVFLPKRNGDLPLEFDKEEHFRLLVAFLRYRGTPLGTRSLYLCAFRKKSVADGRSDKDLVNDYLKPAVSALKTAITGKVKSFEIPRKSPTSGYRCVGEFSFCIAIPARAEPSFCVQSALTEDPFD